MPPCREVLAPIFAEHVGDWSAHEDRIAAFWKGAILHKAGYNGSPMRAHLSAGNVRPEHFRSLAGPLRQIAAPHLPPWSARGLVTTGPTSVRVAGGVQNTDAGRSGPPGAALAVSAAGAGDRPATASRASPCPQHEVTNPQATSVGIQPAPSQTSAYRDQCATEGGGQIDLTLRFRTSGTSLPTTSRISPPKVPVTTPMMTTMTGLNPPASATPTPAGFLPAQGKDVSHRSRR